MARAGEIPTRPPPLLISGEQDHPVLRADAAALIDALRSQDAGDVELRTVPDLAHPLADEPGLEPAPQRATARAVDEILTDWFQRRLPALAGAPDR